MVFSLSGLSKAPAEQKSSSVALTLTRRARLLCLLRPRLTLNQKFAVLQAAIAILLRCTNEKTFCNHSASLASCPDAPVVYVHLHARHVHKQLQAPIWSTIKLRAPKLTSLNHCNKSSECSFALPALMNAIIVTRSFGQFLRTQKKNSLCADDKSCQQASKPESSCGMLDCVNESWRLHQWPQTAACFSSNVNPLWNFSIRIFPLLQQFNRKQQQMQTPTKGEVCAVFIYIPPSILQRFEIKKGITLHPAALIECTLHAKLMQLRVQDSTPRRNQVKRLEDPSRREKSLDMLSHPRMHAFFIAVKDNFSKSFAASRTTCIGLFIRLVCARGAESGRGKSFASSGWRSAHVGRVG